MIEINGAEEIKKILQEENVSFEESTEADDSPLNQPVSEGDIGATKKEEEVETPLPQKPSDQDHAASKEDSPGQEEKETEEEPFVDDGVPEQDIADSYNEALEEELSGETFELPTGHARQAANTFLGITDNVLEIGGGFFVKIDKHKDFYDFEEILEVIDEQNEKNIRKIKLDEDDKVLLRPLLIAILKKKAKKLSPEQQLIGAVISILLKKVKMAVEIKRENAILVEKILEIIREEKGNLLHDEEANPDDPESEQETVSQETEKEERVVLDERMGVSEPVIELANELKESA